jgi:sphingolipid 4-desaturase/C4-monooxygenase
LHPVAAHFIHEHYTFAENQETYSYYGPLNLVTFNVGYHVEHHDFMRVPGWRLPELHALMPQRYNALVSHRSWTWAFYQLAYNRGCKPHRAVGAGQVQGPASEAKRARQV